MDHSTMDHGMQHVVAAAGAFNYGLAFMAGVLGSGHCLGMCGALVSGYFMKAGPSRTLSAVFLLSICQNICLHTGRLRCGRTRRCSGFQWRVR